MNSYLLLSDSQWFNINAPIAGRAIKDVFNHYKKYSDNNVEWIDVNNNEEAQKITSKSYKELLRRMHVIQDGKVIDGAESFLIIWKNVPKYNFLYKIFKIKPLFLILNIFYEIAAYFLFIKNKHLLKNEKN